MLVGVQETLTEVMVEGTVVIVTLALPNFVESWVEVAVMFAVPVLEGVNTPAEVIVPPVAVQATVEL
jgi:2-keto-3-deoxy-6-phosphogluconate aldolase